MRTRNLVHLALLMCAFVTLPAMAWDMNCRFSAQREASIDTAGAERVEIIARGGDLDVRPAQGSRILAGGKACASSEQYLAQTQVHARHEGKVIRVFVQVPDEMQGIGTFYATLDLSVRMPASLPVDVTDTSGDTTIEAVRVAHLTDSSGDLVLRGLLGDIEINDSSGDIRVDEAAGLVKITDSSGDIEVRGARGVLVPSDSSGDIEIERVTGSVRVENDSSGDIEVDDVGGNVDVLVDSSGDLGVSRVKGTVQVPAR